MATSEAGQLELVELEKHFEETVKCDDGEPGHPCPNPAAWVIGCTNCHSVPFACQIHHDQAVHLALVHGVWCSFCGHHFLAPANDLVASWRPI